MRASMAGLTRPRTTIPSTLRALAGTLGPLPPAGAAPGASSENLRTRDLTKADVRLDDRFGVAGMARRVQATSSRDWHYRMQRPGAACSGAWRQTGAGASTDRTGIDRWRPLHS